MKNNSGLESKRQKQFIDDKGTKMRIIILVSLLSGMAFADNCYVHERGSESWYDCKDQAHESDNLRRDNDAALRQLQAETAQDATARAQAEQTARDLIILLREERQTK